jgi:3-deoxy-D-manno-octulosonic-acid transferase
VCTAGTQVYLADTLGELVMLYAMGDVAFVGGSLVPIGGHNLLEPAALGLPILSGPHTFNAEEIAQLFVDRRAVRVVSAAAELATAVGDLLSDPDERIRVGAVGREVLAENRGALDRLLALLEPVIRGADGK